MPNPRIYIARGKVGAWSTRCRSIVLVSLISVAPLDWPGKAPGRRFRLQEQVGVQKTARRHRRAHGNFSLRTRGDSGRGRSETTAAATIPRLDWVNRCSSEGPSPYGFAAVRLVC